MKNIEIFYSVFVKGKLLVREDVGSKPEKEKGFGF